MNEGIFIKVVRNMLIFMCLSNFCITNYWLQEKKSLKFPEDLLKLNMREAKERHLCQHRT